jgi:hypothetical protein
MGVLDFPGKESKMRRTLMTFIGGTTVGVAMAVVSGYVAGFERPRPVNQTVPTVAAVQPQIKGPSSLGWEDLLTVERRIPKELQECVSVRYAGERERVMQTWQRGLTLALERAVGQCVAMKKPPRTVAQK